MPSEREISGVQDLEREGLIENKEDFAGALAQAYEPTEIVELLTEMGLRPSDLALALNVHPRTIRAWLDDSDRTADRQRDDILALKSIVLFLLRQGSFAAKHLAIWLIEPNPDLDFRRPLAVLGEGDSNEALVKVMRASAPFVQPKEPQTLRQSVAAGATSRGGDNDPAEGEGEEAAIESGSELAEAEGSPQR